jgi:hypothetical protein
MHIFLKFLSVSRERGRSFSHEIHFTNSSLLLKAKQKVEEEKKCSAASKKMSVVFLLANEKEIKFA